MIYFTSDLHLGHSNLISVTNTRHDQTNTRHPGQVPERYHFGTIENHDNSILENLRNTLRGGDHLILLGDIAFNIHAFDKLISLLASIKVKTTLIRGNHDDRIAWKYRHKFNESYEALYFQTKKGEDNINIYLSHYACRTWRNCRYGSYHLYGHSHGSLPGIGRSMDVGVNCNNYLPVSLEDVVRKLSGNFFDTKQSHRHPSSELFERWLDGDGKALLDTSILKNPEMLRFMMNRIEAAYQKGFSDGEAISTVQS